MTIGCVSFYVRQGRGLVRMKSNLTKKRWLKDPLFAGSRKSANNFGKAASIASPFYQWLPQEWHKVTFYRQLVALAMKLFTAGAQMEEVEQTLALAVIRLKKMLLPPEKNKKVSIALNSIVKIPFAISQPVLSSQLLPRKPLLKTAHASVRRRAGSNISSQHCCLDTPAA